MADNDEEVDGAAIAAGILGRMPKANRQRILEHMTEQSPRSTALVQALLNAPPGTCDPQVGKITLNSPTEADIQPLAQKIAAVLKELLDCDSTPDPLQTSKEVRGDRVDAKSVSDIYATSERRLFKTSKS